MDGFDSMRNRCGMGFLGAALLAAGCAADPSPAESASVAAAGSSGVLSASSLVAALADPSPSARQNALLALASEHATRSVIPEMETWVGRLRPEEAVWLRLALLRAGRFPGVQLYHILKSRDQPEPVAISGALALLAAGPDAAPVFADIMASSYEHPNPLIRDVMDLILKGLPTPLPSPGLPPAEVPSEVRHCMDVLSVTNKLSLGVDLGQMGGDAQAAGPALEKWAVVPKPEERVWAYHGMARIGYRTGENVAAIAKVLRNPAVIARVHAAGALEMMAPVSLPALDDLIAAADDPDAQVRDFVLPALGSLRSERAVPAVVAVMGKSPRSALLALGRIGASSAAAVPQILEQLDSEDPAVRRVAAYALGHIGSAGETAAPGLALRIGADENADVRHEAMRALAALGSKQPDVARKITECLDSLPPLDAVWARVALLKAGVRPKTQWRALLDGCLKGDTPACRIAAGVALLASGEDARPALADIKTVSVDHPDWLVRATLNLTATRLEAAGVSRRGR